MQSIVDAAFAKLTIGSLFDTKIPTIAGGKWLGIDGEIENDRELDLWTFDASEKFDDNCMFCLANLWKEESGRRFEVGLIPGSRKLAAFAFVQPDKTPVFACVNAEGKVEVLHTECAIVYAYETAEKGEEIRCLLAEDVRRERRGLGRANLEFRDLPFNHYLELMSRSNGGISGLIAQDNKYSDTLLLAVEEEENMSRLMSLADPENTGRVDQDLAKVRNFVLDIVVQVPRFAQALSIENDESGWTVYETAKMAKNRRFAGRQPADILAAAVLLNANKGGRSILTDLIPTYLEAIGHRIFTSDSYVVRPDIDLVRLVLETNPHLIDVYPLTNAHGPPIWAAIKLRAFDIARMLVEEFGADLNLPAVLGEGKVEGTLTAAIKFSPDPDVLQMVSFLLEQDRLSLDSVLNGVVQTIKDDSLVWYKLLEPKNTPRVINRTGDFALLGVAVRFKAEKIARFLVTERNAVLSGNAVVNFPFDADGDSIKFLDFIMDLGFSIYTSSTPGVRLGDDDFETNGSNLLMRAVRANKLQHLYVPYLLSKGAKVAGWSAVAHALFADYISDDAMLQTVRSLLEAGADPNKWSGFKKTPAALAVVTGKISVLAELAKIQSLERFFDPTRRSEGSEPLLHTAIKLEPKEARVKAIKEILRLWPVLEEMPDGQDRTPLAFAIELGRSAELQNLLQPSKISQITTLDQNERRRLLRKKRKRKQEIEEEKKRKRSEWKLACELCDRRAALVCTSCDGTAYCSVACQRDHWDQEHAGECEWISQISIETRITFKL